MLPVGINYNISTFYTAVKVNDDVLNSLTDYEREIYDYVEGMIDSRKFAL